MLKPGTANESPYRLRRQGRDRIMYTMDPDTVEALLVFGKTGAVIGVGCALTLGSIWGMCAAGINYFQRKDRRDELMKLYEEGRITTKPTILNAERIVV